MEWPWEVLYEAGKSIVFKMEYISSNRDKSFTEASPVEIRELVVMGKVEKTCRLNLH